MKSLVLSLLLITAVWAQAPAQTAVPVSQEPSHHLVIENQYTRAYQVEVPGGKATLLHRHDHDYVFVVLGDAHISNEAVGRPPADQQVKDGDVNFVTGPLTHVARNVGQTPFRNVTIEVLRKTTKRICGPGAGTCAGGSGSVEHHGGYSWTTLLETDAVKVTKQEIGAGGLVPRHEHQSGHMVVALSDLHLKNEVSGRGTFDIRQKAGDVVWVQGGSEHAMTNVGKEPARFVVLEFR